MPDTNRALFDSNSTEKQSTRLQPDADAETHGGTDEDEEEDEEEGDEFEFEYEEGFDFGDDDGDDGDEETRQLRQLFADAVEDGWTPWLLHPHMYCGQPEPFRIEEDSSDLYERLQGHFQRQCRLRTSRVTQELHRTDPVLHTALMRDAHYDMLDACLDSQAALALQRPSLFGAGAVVNGSPFLHAELRARADAGEYEAVVCALEAMYHTRTPIPTSTLTLLLQAYAKALSHTPALLTVD